MIMKNLLFAIIFVSVFAAVSQTAFAQQCDRARLTPIKCGYYEEGYQDGVSDARSNQSNDFRRYRSKLDNQYESFYQSGYDDGYSSIQPFARWSDRQKNTYDQGYDDGKDDRQRNISRLPARYEGQYDRQFEAYYNKGYLDGYDNRQKSYDTPISGSPRQDGPIGIPATRPRGTTTGTAVWSGRVDNRVNIILKGNEIRTQSVAGIVTNTVQSMQGTLPRRNATLVVSRLDGRGTVLVVQQPNRGNDFTGIVQIYDPRRGTDNYSLRISWTSANTVEAYAAGKVTWKGRVDARTLIRISGEDVESIDEWKTGLSGVTFNMQGYLAARPGSVRVNKRQGRGTVTIVEQPNAQNDYSAVIRVFDEGGGADDYELEIEW